jgi:hypothetical protein
MDPQNNLKQLQDLFANAKDILIITREQPSIDGLASSLALYNQLSTARDLQGKAKRVVMAIAGRNGTQYSLLPGHDKIVSELGLRDFVIGVNGYVENAIENVNWYVDKGRLNVVFKSNPMVPMQFDLKNLDPFYAGANFDVVVVVDTAQPTDLGNAYRQDPGMYSELPVVNISKDPANTRFGRVNIVDTTVGSVAELCYQLSQIIRLPLSSEVAGLFALGIQAGTNKMQNKGAQTDAVLAQLQPYNPKPFDLDAVVAQGSEPKLPVHKNPPPVPTGTSQATPSAQIPQSAPAPAAAPMPNQNPQPPQQPYYPPAPASYPAQPNMQYPQGQGQQQSPQYYPPMPQQPAYPYNMQPPVGYPQYQSQPQMIQDVEPVEVAQAAQTAPQYLYDEPAVEQTEVSDNSSELLQQQYDVPSIEHDYSHQDQYIPTSGISGFDHVEPSLSMPYVQHSVAQEAPEDEYPKVQDYFAQNTDNTQAQYQAPDWSVPPKIFNDGKSQG